MNDDEMLEELEVVDYDLREVSKKINVLIEVLRRRLRP